MHTDPEDRRDLWPRKPGDPHYLVIWDGQCELCRRAVGWVVKRDKKHRFQFLPYQDASLATDPKASELIAEARDAVQVITPEGQRHSGGMAVLVIVDMLGWKAIPRLMGTWPLVGLVKAGYGLVAKNRRSVLRFIDKIGGSG